MSNEIKGGGQSQELSTDINVITAEIRMDLQGISDAIFRVGERLIHVRKNEMDKRKGGWNKYCTEELGITRDYANRFIRVYERFGSGDPGRQLPNSLTVLDRLIDFTDEELEQTYELPSGESKKPTEMSRREIEELKKALKESKEREEQAEQRAQQAERSEDIARRQLEEAESREPVVTVRTEYIEVDNTPDDYEQLKKEKEELAKRLAEIPETKQAQENDRPYGVKLGVEMYEALSELSDWQKKYSWIITDVGEFSRLAEADPNFRREFNRLNEFWRQMNEAINRHKGTEVFDADYTIIN